MRRGPRRRPPAGWVALASALLWLSVHQGAAATPTPAAVPMPRAASATDAAAGAATTPLSTTTTTTRRKRFDPPRERRFPWVRTTLAVLCGLTGIGTQERYARVGWWMFGAGLGTWAAWDATTTQEQSLAGGRGPTISVGWSF